MEPSVATTRRRPAAFQIDVRNCCAPLPKQVRDKWKEWETAREANRDTTLEDLVSRLQRAEKRREEFRSWLTSKPKRTAQVRSRIAEQKAFKAKKLEDKLAYAEKKRHLRLEHIRSKAQTMLQRSELAAERVNERQELMAQKLYETLNAAETRRLALIEAEKERLSAAHELVVSKLAQVQEKEEQEREETKKQLGARLVQADNMRTALLAAASVKAGDKVRHAKHVSKMRRLNEERDTELKRSCLLVRLQTAADRRREVFSVRAAVNAEKSETQFLKRQSTKREKLRRSSSSRVLQNSWLSFRDSNKTTKELAIDVLKTNLTFITLDDNISETPAQPPSPPAAELKDPFDEFASRLRSEDTINAFKAFLNRVKMKLLGKSQGVHDCSSLLKRLFPKIPKGKVDRYPPRVFLCAYMILNHPEVVFNAKGDREAALSTSSKVMVEAFERLVQRYTQPVVDPTTQHKRTTVTADLPSFSELFNAFDDCWVAYLEQFVAWKLHDAAGLADSLIRMASKMQMSMLRKVDGDINSDRVKNNSDLKNIIKQVQHDHQLLRERVQRLAGAEGLKEFDAALEACRDKYESESKDITSESNTAAESDTSSTSVQKSESESSSGGGSRPRGSGNGGRPPRRSPMDRDQEGIPANAKKEVFVWELLYDRNFQLDSDMIDGLWSSALAGEDIELPRVTTEAAPLPAKTIQKQIASIAEKAFWDSVEERLTSESGGAAVRVCTLLLEIGSDLSAMLPNTAAAKVVNQHLKDEAELLKLLQGEEQDANDLNTGGLLQLLEHTSELLRECGSEARNEEAMEAQQRVRESIVKALEQGERSLLAKAVCRALRLLHGQLNVLRFDLANARLRALSSVLTGATAIKYSQDKFATSHGLTPGQDPADKLPRTRQWREQAVELRRSLELVLEPLAAEITTSRTNIPVEMRSGVRVASSSVHRPLEQWPEVHYISPVAVNSWRAAFRVGLIHLVSAPLPLTSQNIPETLHLDIKRLHNIQNALQKLVVTCAALLTLQQVKQETLPQEALLEMKGRLGIVLESPTVNLSILTAELTRMAGTESEVEQHISNTLINLINREKGGFKALNNGLTKAMSICLIAGDSMEAPSIKRAVQAMLSKIRSGYLQEDVMEVARDLSVIVGINEAVHGQIYESMF